MSDQNAPEAPEAPADDRVAVGFRYGDTSGIGDDGDGARLALFADLARDPVRAQGTLKNPVAVREALSALHAVVKSDLRYAPRDRTAYLAWKRLQTQTAGMAAWQAQQAYFDWLARNDPAAWFVLDPVVSVHPDGLLFEVFSKDEGSYAALKIDWDAIDLDDAVEVKHGTTHIDFSDNLFDGIQRMRSYRETKLSIGHAAVEVQTEGQKVIEKQIKVPESWLRGFLQVQSASTLTRTSASFAPIELYNALRQLRLNADEKKKGRALRLELVPAEPPRIVLEPWQTLIESSTGAYSGRKAEVIKLWGRRRLMMLQRFLPFAESVEVHAVGTGLPSFWVLRGGPLTFTLGLTGFTASNWSQSVLFDILLPRPDAETDALVDAALSHLRKTWVDGIDGIAEAIGQPVAETRRALQSASQRGLVMYDIAAARYRLRPLIADPPDPARLKFRNAAEKAAHALVETKGAVKVESINRIPTVGTEVVGKVVLAAERREFRPTMLIDDQGGVRKADCTCPPIRKNGLRRGPCAHLIALRLALAAQRRAEAAKGRGAIEIETRTYARRRGSAESVYQVSLDRTKVRVRWGERDGRQRLQNLRFDTTDDARAAYFERIDALEARGYLDATAE